MSSDRKWAHSSRRRKLKNSSYWLQSNESGQSVVHPIPALRQSSGFRQKQTPRWAFLMTDFKSGSCRRYLLESERPPVPPSPLSTGPDGEKCCSRTPGSSAFFAEGPFKAGEGGEGGGWPTLAQWESGLTRQQPAMQGCQTRTADASPLPAANLCPVA